MTESVTTSPKLYIGIDMHKKSWKLRWCTDLFDGATKTFTSDPVALKKYVDKYYPGHEVHCAYESGSCGYSAVGAFQSYGWEVLVLNPSDIPRPGKQRVVKTDKIDSKNLAKQLKHGSLQGIHIPDMEQEQLRSLFRRRFDLVKDLRRIKSRIKSFLLYYGIALPESFDNSNWSRKFINWLEALKWEYLTAKQTLDSMLSNYHFVDKQIREVSNQIRGYCRKHYKGDYYLLRSVPGIGGLIAAAFISEIGDMRRFTSFKQLASYVGLVPGIYQSGENIKTLGMTPRKNRILRSYMVESAWIACRKDPVMQAYYRSHIGKDSKKIIVKVARKLLSRMLAVIRSGISYEIGIVQ